MITYKICPDDTRSSFFVDSGLPLGWRLLQLFDLLKVLADAGNLGENGVVFDIDTVEAQGGW